MARKQTDSPAAEEKAKTPAPKAARRMRTTRFTLTREVAINGRRFEAGEVFAEVSHPDDVPANKVIAGIYNGHAADLREQRAPADG